MVRNGIVSLGDTLPLCMFCPRGQEPQPFSQGGEWQAGLDCSLLIEHVAKPSPGVLLVQTLIFKTQFTVPIPRLISLSLSEDLGLWFTTGTKQKSGHQLSIKGILVKKEYHLRINILRLFRYREKV